MEILARIWKEGKWFVSWSPDFDIASQGRTPYEAFCNLQEAVNLYLEDYKKQIPKLEVEFDLQISNSENSTITETCSAYPTA